MEPIKDDTIIAFIKKLPDILKKYPELRKTLFDALGISANLGRIIQDILLELKHLREDFNKQFEAFSRRMDAFERRMDAFEEQMMKMREDFNKQFEAFSRRMDAFEKRMDMFEERMDAFERRMDAFEEQMMKMREDFNKQFEAFSRRMDAFEKRMDMFEERMDAFERRMDAFEEQMMKMREDFNKQFEAFSRQMNAFEKVLMSVERRTTALGARWGYESESSFRNAIKGLLEEDFGVTVKKWEYYDSEGFVYWRPSTVEVDVLIKDSKHILIEIKSSISKNDVAMFLKKGELYKRVTGVEPELMIVSPFIDPDAEAYAKDNNIRIYTKI
ncbi:MAG: DUF3782 domain-containing protein [Candidatus Asgardarchaeum sp.]